MGVVEELARARADFERGDWSAALGTWSDADPSSLTPEDLDRAGEAAYLLGRRELALELDERAHLAHLRSDDVPGALRSAFHLVMIAATSGEPSKAAGWLATAERLLADVPADIVERGYITFAQMFRCAMSGDLAGAAVRAEEAVETGRRHHDGELMALALCGLGRVTIMSGRVAEGLALLDEAMTALLAHGRSPEVFGNVYCTAIEGCQEVREVGRVAEWTSGLQRWCEAHPSLVAFTGQCSLHRGQLLAAQGALREAVDEFDSAIERYRGGGQLPAIGQAAYERGEALRILGDLDGADESFRLAGECGYDPQPGLALLWTHRGELGAAAGAARRLVAEPGSPVDRVRVLPGLIEVLLACGDVDTARSLSAQLDSLANSFGFDAVHADAASAAATVELAAGDPTGALPYARKARSLWTRLENPYAAGLAQVCIGRALRALGDEGSARVELEAARAVLARLGAAPAVQIIDELVSPRVPDRPDGLSERELEVLRLVAVGRSNQQIAALLVISDRTVARHLSNIFTKLDVGSRTAAAAYAYEHHLV
ncbi:LuxR family transcriptional regulator [Intrasporangium chromatireducens Q5-1]|uniref:LuxR family transcriptional regulator n=1 Tax=Intrasporangium chromatireducens Q5-1 TaxID=584657 RepID=W9GG70_9MICO|nr:LuxR C-terminal-related transcriptional regulator [Intrasporangium chromatireducens]EWT05231.1 LuxR family transcriptional regulator [Intrasporangium chromatireducens Q5-1]